MLTFNGNLKVYVALEPCDMRKSFNTLAALARNHLGLDPLSGAAFLFTNKSRRLIKILYFDGTGYWLVANRHAPQCAFRFVLENPLSVPSALREGLRVFWLGWRQKGHGLRAACRPVDPRRTRLDVRSGGLFGSEGGRLFSDRMRRSR
jgi:hypothetical protein